MMLEQWRTHQLKVLQAEDIFAQRLKAVKTCDQPRVRIFE